MNKFSSSPNARGLRIPLDNSFSTYDCKASSENRSAPVGKVKDPAIDEKALVRSAQQGDLQAFNHLVLAYQDKAFTQAYYLLGDSMMAEDIVQEAFISAYIALPTYRGGSFRSWLLRIVTNKCLDELRRRKRHIETGFEVSDEWGNEVESPSWSIDTGETPEESLIRAEIGGYLLLCLDCLNAEYRTTLVLVDVLEMSYSEAAEVLGCPIGTVKSRLARARLQMQDLLRDHIWPIHGFIQQDLDI